MNRSPVWTSDLGTRVRERLSTALPAYLPRQRWFGDKARRIDSVAVAADFPIEKSTLPMALAIIDVRFHQGPPSRYALPIVIRPAEANAVERICELDPGGKAAVEDALVTPEFRDWLLELLMDGRTIDSAAGRLRIERLGDAQEVLRPLQGEPSRVLGVEQSNSSIVYGRGAFIKVFRRLMPGINPDAELTRFLTAKADFANAPRFLGSVALEPTTGGSMIVAIAQTLVDATADGWTFVVGLLKSHVLDGNAQAMLEDSTPIARRLGQVTAALHLALARDPWTADFAPERIGPDDVAGWSRDCLDMLDRIAAGLQNGLPNLGSPTAELATAFLDLAPGLRKRVAGFERLLGREKIRVHGDYHLGQTLRTASGDFVVIDFEGEPQRTIDERRRKTSPLKDVAGMLRSFSYARGTVQRELAAAEHVRPSDLVAWERLMRRGFLAGYVETARHGGAAFLPQSDGDLQSALDAWEIDKAIYEVLYELNNRPDWLWIPLSALVKQGEPER